MEVELVDLKLLHSAILKIEELEKKIEILTTHNKEMEATLSQEITQEMMISFLEN
mgnify:CR=1 FL=1